eukprot:6197026-Pleurochrysis_carterae.AAC.2
MRSAFATLDWRSETEQMREFDDLCRHMTERHLSKYVSSTCVNLCKSCSRFAEAHEFFTEVFIKVIITIQRYLEPESLVADSDCRSDSTSRNEDVVPPAEFPKSAPPAGETIRIGDAYPSRVWRVSSHGTKLDGPNA